MNAQGRPRRDEPARAGNWREYRIGFHSVSGLAGFATGPVPDLIGDVLSDGSADRAFLVRKSPGLRLRIRWTADRPDAIAAALQLMALEHAGILSPPMVLRPYRETELLGGDAGCDLAEWFFTHDTALVLALARRQATGAASPDPPSISLAVLRSLFGAVAADRWELWAMWQRLAAERGGADGAQPGPPGPAARPDIALPECDQACQAASVAGRRLRELAEAGGLATPLRSTVTVWAAFHLNRMGYDGATQAALAQAEAARLTPHGTAPQAAARNAIKRCGIAFERVALGPGRIFDHPDLDSAYARLAARDWSDAIAVLEGLVPALPPAPRHALLAVKRALHRGRAPASRDLALAADHLPEGLHNRLLGEVRRQSEAPSELAAAIGRAERALVDLALDRQVAAALAAARPPPDRYRRALAGIPQGLWGKPQRKAFATAATLLWRHGGRTTPCGDLAATRIFDSRAPLRDLTVDCPFDRAPPAAPFGSDRYDPRPGQPLPDGMDAAISVAARIFSRLDAPEPSPSQRLFARAMAALGLPDGGLLEECAGRAEAAVAAACLPRQHAGSLPHLAVALGIAADPADTGWLDPGLIAGIARDPATSIAVPEGQGSGPARRVSIRLQPGRDGIILRFFGGDRMSLLARYLPRGRAGPATVDPLRREAATWLSSWPELVDVTLAGSSQPLDAHEPLTLRGPADGLSGFRLLPDPQAGLFDLYDANGLPARAAHFGVSQPHALTTAAALALAAGSRRPSWGEWLLDQVNAALIDVLASARDMLLLPRVDVGGDLVLAPGGWALPPSAPVHADLAAADMAGMAARLTAAGLVPGPVRAQPLGAPEGQVFDLRLPAGARKLHRLGRDRLLTVEPLVLGEDGRAMPEYYLELSDSD